MKTAFANCQGVIFDFDGLIADSEPFHFRAYNEVFQRYGHTLDPEEYWVEFTSKGTGIKGEIERHNLRLNVKPEDLRKEKFAVYSTFCKNGDIPLFPDAVRLVEVLRARHRIAIASGSFTHDIRSILGHARADHLFTIILGKESAPREKPHPDIFLKAAESMGCDPHQCVVIEDALKGLAAAKSAGMPCVIIRNPLNLNIDFTGADLIVSGLAELVTLIDNSPAPRN